MPEWTVDFTDSSGCPKGRDDMAWGVLRDGVVWDWPLSSEKKAEDLRQRREAESMIPEDNYLPARGWEPGYLVEWLFYQDDIWITAKRESVLISQMDVGHALNTLLFLERVEDDLELRDGASGIVKGSLQETPLYRALKGRVWRAVYGAA